MTAGPAEASVGIVAGASIMWVIGKSYGLMVRRFPVAGGEFAYAYQGFGRNATGFSSFIPLNATALGILGRFVAPDLFSQGYLYTIAGFDVCLGEVLLSTGVILLFGIINYRGGVKSSGRMQLLMVGLLVWVPSCLWGGGAWFSGAASIEHLEPLFAPDKTPLAGILAILAIAPWLFVGFDTIPQAAEAYRFHPRQADRLIGLALLIGAGLYVIMLITTGLVVPWTDLVASKPVWATGQVAGSSRGCGFGGSGLYEGFYRDQRVFCRYQSLASGWPVPGSCLPGLGEK